MMGHVRVIRLMETDNPGSCVIWQQFISAGIRGITAREDSCTPPAFLILKLHFLHPFWTLNDFKQRSKRYFSLDQGDYIQPWYWHKPHRLL